MPVLAVVIAFSASLFAQQQPFDIVIAGGRLVDGTGSPYFYSDLGVRGDSIVEIGNLTSRPTKLRIDAKGLTVSPGFIDVHSHAIRGIYDVPSAENCIRQGVTSVIEGPDGSSPVPLKPELEKLSKTPISINFGLCVGHGSIRGSVIGSERRKPTPAEMEKMKGIARQAMLDGAFGLSTGLFYVPGNYAETEEVIELAKVVGSLGGYHISHMRDEGIKVLDSVKETIRIGEEGGLPTQITHHKIIGKANWGDSLQTLRLVENARERGVDVTIDQYPYTASSTSLGAALFPQWSFAGGRAATLERLKAPQQRALIKTEVARRIENERGGGDPKNIVFARCDFDPSLSGRSLADATAAKGLAITMENAAEVAMELQEKGGCSAIFHAISEEDVVRILRSPYSMVASDGGIPIFGKDHPHPRSYGSFSRILGRYVRDFGTLKMEEAVRKMSGLPAQRVKLYDRGLLRPGMKADIVVFDPKTIEDKADFNKPHQYAAGVRDVLVNGKFALRDSKMTTDRPGRVLYGPARIH